MSRAQFSGWKLRALTVFPGLFWANAALADQATLARVSGQVEVLSEPTEKPGGPGPYVGFEGQYYKSMPAKVGAKVSESFAIKTGADSKALLFYPNGDSITVGANSFAKLRTHPGEKSLIKLIQGTVRSQVLKNGENSNMEVTTRTQVMGVRGTDFVVKRPGTAGDSEVIVIRGEVEVKAAESTAKPVPVKAGETASTPAPVSAGEPPAAPVVTAVEKPALVAVQTETAVAPAPANAEIKKLEAKAAANVLSDIKQTDPDLYKKIEQQGDAAKSSYALNTMAVSQKYEQALGAVEPEKKTVFALNPTCEPPALISPVADAKYVGAPTEQLVIFEWKAAANECKYEWVVARDSSSQVVVKSETTDATTTRWSAPLGAYSWKVRGVGQDGRTGLWSQALRFLVSPPAGAPVEPVGVAETPAVKPVNEAEMPPEKPVEEAPEAAEEKEKPGPAAPADHFLARFGFGGVSYTYRDALKSQGGYSTRGGGSRAQVSLDYRPSLEWSLAVILGHVTYDEVAQDEQGGGSLLVLSGQRLFNLGSLLDLGTGIEFREEAVVHRTVNSGLRNDKLQILYPVVSLVTHSWPRTNAHIDLRYGILAGSQTIDVANDKEMSVSAGYERQWFSFPLSLGLAVEAQTYQMKFTEDNGVDDAYLKITHNDVMLISGWSF